MTGDVLGEQGPVPQAPPAENISDEAGVRERNRRVAGDRYRAEQIVRRLMNDRDGRAWVFELLKGCHIFATSYMPGDPHGTTFCEGERNAGLKVLSQIPADLYATMMQEAQG